MSASEDYLPISSLKRNYTRAQEQVAEALAKSGRSSDSLRVLAVTKYVDAEATRRFVLETDCCELGESRPQVLWQKQAELARDSQLAKLHWHMIGHLQRNKVAKTVPLIEWLHSLDSLRLAQAVNDEALKLPDPLNVLVEVNVSEDDNKTGLKEQAVATLMEQLLSLPGLKVRGLMAMSTEGSSADQSFREFSSVRLLRDRLQTRFGPAVDLSELSMGMSGDFVSAIAAGATMVRLGSILWEGL